MSDYKRGELFDAKHSVFAVPERRDIHIKVHDYVEAYDFISAYQNLRPITYRGVKYMVANIEINPLSYCFEIDLKEIG